MSMCRVFSCVVGRGCLLWPVHFLGKTLLAFALLHFVLQDQTCLLLQVSLDFLLLNSSPLWDGDGQGGLACCNSWGSQGKNAEVIFQDRPFSITVIQAYVSTTNVEEVEQCCEDRQDCLDLTPKKDILFITGDWNAKVGSQEILGITGKFGLGIQNEAGQKLTKFCQEYTLAIANILFQQHKR